MGQKGLLCWHTNHVDLRVAWAIKQSTLIGWYYYYYFHCYYFYPRRTEKLCLWPMYVRSLMMIDTSGKLICTVVFIPSHWARPDSAAAARYTRRLIFDWNLESCGHFTMYATRFGPIYMYVQGDWQSGIRACWHARVGSNKSYGITR